MILLADIRPNGLHELLKRQWSEEGQKYMGGAAARKAEFKTRLRIDTEQHRQLIVQRIHRLFQTAEIADAIAEHADTRRNVLKRVVDRVATPYETPPTREIRDVDADLVRDFLDAYREADTDTTAETWSRYAFLCNVVHVLPRWEGEPGELRWVTVLPHEADVVWDPLGEHDPSILVYACTDLGARWVAVDRERWWWLSKDWEILEEEEHGLGMSPWAEFRVAPRQPGDYWCRGAGRSLVDGALQVGLISAQMEWVRRTHANKLITLHLGENDATPPGQTIQGETPYISRGDQTRFAVHDTIVPIDNFVGHIADIVADLAESYGLPANEIDPLPAAADGVAPAGPRAFERLTKLRTSMLKHLRKGETQLAVRAGALLASKGRMSGVGASQIKRGFRCTWLPPTFADTPKSQAEAATAKIDLGATNLVEFYQSQNPGTTFEDAKAEVMRNLELRAEFNEFQASRNLPASVRDDAATLAQLQGRTGGQKAAANRSSDDEPEEKDETEDQ
jgi:hypothetical protein